jgi:hypothetical protein
LRKLVRTAFDAYSNDTRIRFGEPSSLALISSVEG